MLNNDIIIKASEYYKNEFANNKENELSKYITQTRHFNKETISDFGIGISLNGNGIVEYLSELGYTIQEMRSNGIIRIVEEEAIDFLNERFIIGIRNIYGDLIAFGGRRLGDDKRYKYLNTKTTPLFTKKKTVFNLDKAKYYIDYINNPYLILVEGYCDVMSLWQNGIRNIICTMGTACSDEQAKLIKMFCNKVIICYDGDKAGQIATEKAYNILKDNNIETYKLCLPNNQDPDEFLKQKNGKGLFLELVNKCFEGEQ